MTVHNQNKTTEGDINLSPARTQWTSAIDHSETKMLLEEDARYFLHQAMSTPCLDVLATSQGSELQNLQGQRYLDFHGNNVHQLGYQHPILIENLARQLQQLPFSPRRYTNAPAVAFAKKLAALAPSDLNRILLTPNGSSAVGIALKLARAVTGKFKVISFWDSFHGASLDAISVGGEAVFREGMGPLLPGIERIPPPVTYRGLYENNEAKCLEYLEYVIQKEGDIGAFIAETVRNTDVQIPSISFWKKARALCTEHNIVLILDEIPIALGRTGHMFAFEHYGIEPDILCLGKGLGGGIFPQAAIVTRDAYNVCQDISLGHYTHEKSPLGAVCGLSTLEIIEQEHLLSKVKADGLYIKKRLLDMQVQYPIIGDIRGMGLLWGVELVTDSITKQKATEEAETLLYACLSAGLSFKISAGNVLQLSPPLTITRSDLDRALSILESSLQKVTIGIPD